MKLFNRKPADYLEMPYAADLSEKLITIDRTDKYLGHPDLVMTDVGRLLIVYPAGHGQGQIIMKSSDDFGKTWSERRCDLPKSWARSQETPTIYNLHFTDGHTKLILISGAPYWKPTIRDGVLIPERRPDGFNFSFSDDNGETWSDPAVLCPEPRWHQSCTAVDIYDGKVTLVYEKWVADGHKWPGVGPVLMQASVDADLTQASSWKFSELYNPDGDLEAARPSGIPVVPPGEPGILETNVVRMYDKTSSFYDSTGRSLVLMCRAHLGVPEIGVMLRGYEREDGSLAIGRLPRKDGEVYFVHIPGADLKFYVLYDPEMQLYWLLHSQTDGRMNARRRLALSYSPDLLRWTFAGLVAVGPSDHSARHYATMILDGDDLCIVSRSGDENARTAHDGNIVTFHRVRRFRDLVY